VLASHGGVGKQDYDLNVLEASADELVTSLVSTSNSEHQYR
jgi:hypothetical protein